MSLPPLCLTGASGFVGRRLLARLADLAASDVTLLLRDPSQLAPRAAHPSWRVIQADLAKPIPSGSIPSDSVVIHLAAATGNADRRSMQRVNVDGTARLLEAASAASARHFVFVSSIAAGYIDQHWAPYATSKAAAEGLVSVATLPHTLVRPTMVFGPGSPNQRALERLATLAFPVMPGQGHVRIQPIHVDDLVRALLHLATSPPQSAIVTVGGPTTLTMRELFAAIRRARGLRAQEPITVPLGPLRRVLAAAGWLSGGRFPVSAGQFAAFANDALAQPPGGGGGGGDSVRLPAPQVSLDAMLARREGDA